MGTKTIVTDYSVDIWDADLMKEEIAIEPEISDEIQNRLPKGVAQVQVPSRILIVDDEPDVLMALGKRLSFTGYEVEYASDGFTATTTALRMRPDLIILDIGMPCGDGHTVAERIRNNINTMFTPIIFLTARTAQEDKLRAHEADAFAYVTKPFKTEDLLDLIDRALNPET